MKYTRKEVETKNPVRLVSTTIDDVVGDLSLKVGFVQTATSCRGSDYSSIIKKIETAVSKSSYDLIVAPEYSFVPKSRVFDESEKDELLEQVVSSSKGYDTLIVPGTFLWQKNKELRNTAYFVKGGKIVYAYDKIRDGGEESLALEYGLGFKCGSVLGCFNHLSLKIGVEICADGGILFEHKVEDRDLLILLSCGVGFTAAYAKTAEYAKFTIINDGNKFYSKVQVYNNSKLIFTRNLR